MKDRAVIFLTIVFLALIMFVLLNATGCGKSDDTEGVYGNYFTEESSPRFTVIESRPSYNIGVDTQTGVEYLFTSKGNVTVLVDQEGKPYIANGWRDYGE